MSAWPGKFVIGLTGNIATGKSVVRRMLEHLGAYGIDADALGHRAIAKGAPGYQPVLDTFGSWILNSGGHIDRTKLGRVVFADADVTGGIAGFDGKCRRHSFQCFGNILLIKVHPGSIYLKPVFFEECQCFFTGKPDADILQNFQGMEMNFIKSSIVEV